MKKSLFALLVAGCSVLPAWAQPAQQHTPKHTPQQIAQDIQRHRAMAAAHEAAAKCLEAGRGEKVCHQELRTACKGLGIGKYCGMRHVH